VDTLSKTITTAIDNGLIRELRDHAGRVWAYGYDGEGRLVEVVRPATTGFPAGTTVRYGYDDEHRLTTVTSPNGAVVLVNRYDDQGRVVEQTHGTGTYTFAYAKVGRGRSLAVRVTCGLKNGGTLVVDHDPAGHPVSRRLSVRRGSFAAEDLAADAGATVPVVTTTRYNANGEAVEQTRPAGTRVSGPGRTRTRTCRAATRSQAST
jgi:YD repeat-containing protein